MRKRIDEEDEGSQMSKEGGLVKVGEICVERGGGGEGGHGRHPHPDP